MLLAVAPVSAGFLAVLVAKSRFLLKQRVQRWLQ
jgi:hypothetical protein